MVVPMVVLEVLSWLLAAAFFVAGGTKLASLNVQREAFRAIGYPQWLRLMVGGAEVLAAALLLVPPWRVVGVGLIVVVTLGAVHAHLYREHVPAHALPPAVLGGLALALVLGPFLTG